MNNNNNNNKNNNNGNGNSNDNSNNNSTSGYRTIIPAPPPTSSMIPSPHHSPQVHPNPHHGPQHGITLPPPFGTPPVSPFSHPMNSALPPPLKSLPPIMSSIPKQQGPTTSVFSVPMTPSNANSVVMQHHTSVIHPYHHHHNVQHRLSLSGAATGNESKPLTTADQRELARKVSHSAIERRRREKINDKIMQLKDLIPSCADQDHLHKLSILQSAIEYIQYLQGCVLETRKREGGNSEERITKKSKFDRYEIPIPQNIYNSKNKDDHKITDDSSKSKNNKEEERINHDEANALLLLSKSSTTTNTNSDNMVEKKIPETRDVEVQTSPNMKEITADRDEEESTPSRSAMTVQQLLC